MENILALFLESSLAAAIVVVVGFLARKYLVEVISQAVRFDFETKLEQLRAELRQKESEIAALRDGALSRMVSIQAAIATRRMQAGDELWRAVVRWNELVPVVTTIGMLKFENVSARIERDSKLQSVLKSLHPGNLLEQTRVLGALAENERPYLSDLSWALFTAYRSIFSGAAAKAHMFANGIDPRPFMNPDGIDQMLRAALPDQEQLIAQGPSSHLQLLDVLKGKILEEIRNYVEGKEQDAESVRRAAAVVRVAAAIELEHTQKAAKAGIPT